MSTSTTTLIALVLAACSAFGCSSSFAAATPPAFVELDGQKTYDYRATSADGVVLSVRAIDNEPKGTLSFWSEVVERKLRLGEGYALLEKRDVAARRGEHGTQLRFGRDQGGVPHLYCVTVFVTDKRIFVLEAGGTKVDMERYAESIDWSVRNFAIRLANLFTKTSPEPLDDDVSGPRRGRRRRLPSRRRRARELPAWSPTRAHRRAGPRRRR